MSWWLDLKILAVFISLNDSISIFSPISMGQKLRNRRYEKRIPKGTLPALFHCHPLFYHPHWLHQYLCMAQPRLAASQMWALLYSVQLYQEREMIIKHAPNWAGQKSFSVLNEKGHFHLNESLSKHTNFWTILPRKLSSTFTLALDYFYFSSVFTPKQNLVLFYIYINMPDTASKIKEKQSINSLK